MESGSGSAEELRLKQEGGQEQSDVEPVKTDFETEKQRVTIWKGAGSREVWNQKRTTAQRHYRNFMERSNNQGLYLINSGLHSEQEQPRRGKTPGMGVRSLGGYKKERVASASESYLTVGESSRIEWRSRKVVLEAEGGRKMYKMSTHLLPRETRY